MIAITTIAFLLIAAVNNFSVQGKIENFTLKDYNGKEHSLSDYKDSKAIVLMFIATECPVSNAYNSRMENIYNEYNQKNVAFIGINSNKAESVDRIKEHAIENGLTFTILKDEKNIIADKFEASFTPEVYILSSDFNILYHGRIDNSRNESEVVSKDLENALNEILAGKEITKKETKAFGCTIKRI
ncbi:MAG: thioredoxin family protein [Ignavibacteriaceae bacterium]